MSLKKGTVETEWTQHPNEVYTSSVVVTEQGLTVNNGKISVRNNSGTEVFKGDNNGNIRYTGTITGSYADFLDTVKINGQGGNGWAQILLKSREGLEGNIYTGDKYGINIFSPNDIYIGGKYQIINTQGNVTRVWSSNGGLEKRIDFEPVKAKITGYGLPLTLSSEGNRINVEKPLYVDGACLPNRNSVGGYDLGSPGLRWYTVYSVTTLNTSDIRYKKNIKYLDEEESPQISTYSLRAASLTEDPTQSTPTQSTKYYDFIRDDLRLAEYDYIRDGESKVEDHQIGFIAQDIIDTEVGSKFCYDMDEGMGFSTTGYTSVLAKALQEAIAKIESLEQRIEELESRLDEKE